MKLQNQVILKASPNQIFNTLIELHAYSEWNTIFPLVQGNAAPESSLTLNYAPPFETRQTLIATVTGFIAPRYFSFEFFHKWGSWALREEFIFRLQEKGDQTTFIAEVYVTGLLMRFRRAAIRSSRMQAVIRFTQGLQERLGESAF